MHDTIETLINETILNNESISRAFLQNFRINPDLLVVLSHTDAHLQRLDYFSL